MNPESKFMSRIIDFLSFAKNLGEDFTSRYG